MNWIAIEAIGSLFAAFATTAAVIVALYQSGVIFREHVSIHFSLDFILVDPPNSKNVYQFKVINKGNRPIYVQSFGLYFGRDLESLIIINPEYGTLREPLPPGKSSCYHGEKEYLVRSVKDFAHDNKGIENRKVKVIIATELKTHIKKTKYKVKDFV